MPAPSSENDFKQAHVDLLTQSYERLLGKPLYDSVNAETLYHAPLILLSHNTETDPILTYGNLAAQRLWNMDWDRLTTLPSRLTAEAQHRDERDAMFLRMRQHGFIDDYTGMRISATGQRFMIRNAVIWTLADESGMKQGEAAAFSEYEFL